MTFLLRVIWFVLFLRSETMSYSIDYISHFGSSSGQMERVSSPEAPGGYIPDIPLTIPEQQTPLFWTSNAQDFIKKRIKEDVNKNRAKNIILFIGDGMSIPTLTSARILKGQKMGKFGEQESLSFENFRYTGLAKTYCSNKQVADSACTSTAYMCGIKAGFFTLGVDGSVPFSNCSASQNSATHVQSIAQWAGQAGKSTGIVTTTRITHASPAGAFAHSANRLWESDADIAAYGIDTSNCDDIAKQLILNEPGIQFNVIFGGGRSKFLPNDYVDEEGIKGERLDGFNLINRWKKNNPKGKYISNREELQNLNINKTEAVLGLFASSHLNFNLLADRKKQPSLSELTDTAIRLLSKEKQGYFLFVEGGLIDHGHHLTTAQLAIDETLEFAKAVETAVNITSAEDTLIVVSSDHSHTMSIAGYPNIGNDIFGFADISSIDDQPYTTLSYANGPQRYLDATGKRLNIEGKISPTFQYPANVPLPLETHGGDDVGVFASGPFAHLFTGVYEQNNIPHLMAYASCIGKGLTACDP